MATLTLEQIRAANDLQRELVYVPEWGGDVYVRSLMSWEKDSFEKEQLRRRQNGTDLDSIDGQRARFAALVITDENGERIFKSAADITMLGRKSGVALDRILTAATKLNGIGAAGEEEAKKNSELTETNDSGTGSVPA